MNNIGNEFNTTGFKKFAITMSLTSKRVILNFKSLVTNLLTLILLFVVPTIFCFSTIIIAPVKYDLGIILCASIILMELVTYGTVAGSFRRSTLNKNTNLTIGVRWIDNLATIATMFLMGVIMVSYVLFLLSIFDWTGILLITVNKRSNMYENVFITSISLSIIYYYTIVLTLITYSFSYFFQGFFDSDMMFFTLGVIVFISLIVFGAVFNDYFYIEKVITNPDPRSEISQTTIFYNHNTPFGDGMFIPTLFYPFYVPAQMIKMNGQLLTHTDFNSNVLWTFFGSNDATVLGSDAWKWNILWFIPYLHIFFWWTIGFTYKFYIK